MNAMKEIRGFDPAKRAFSLFDEFKNFALKGNVIDLAVGVIIGAAFGKIVGSMVNDIIMPVISVIMPGTKTYETWAWVINDKPIPYGKFIAEVLNFTIVALVLFIFIVKFLGWIMKARRQEVAAPPPPPPPTREEVLLAEIRDLLRQRAAT